MGVSGRVYSYAQLEALWISAGGPRSVAPVMAAIAMAESAGGVSSTNNNTNGTQDRGLWQINSVHNFTGNLFDPAYNAKAAVDVYRSQGLHAWSTYNNGAYQSHLQSGVAPVLPSGNAPNASASSGGSSRAPSATGNPTPALNMNELAAQYGFTASMLNADASLKSLFSQAVAGTWSSAKFQAELQNTSWWRGKSAAARTAWIQQYADPASYLATYNSQQATVNNIASEFGLSMFKSASFMAEVKKATSLAIAGGWNDAQIRNYFGQRIGNLSPGNDHYGGKLGQFQDQLTQVAYQNGVSAGLPFISGWVKKLGLGTASIEQAEAAIRHTAANQFPAYKAQILAGENLQDIAAPYIKSMSDLLEINPAKVDLFDPMIKKGLQNKDAKGAWQATPLWQFEDTVRADPRWKQTNNARDAAMTNARHVLTDFGLVH